MTRLYYRAAAAALIVYDITDQKSFEVMEWWINELQSKGPSDVVLAIAGNKCDLEDKREASSWKTQ